MTLAPNHWGGAPKRPYNITSTSIQYIYSRKALGSNMEAPNMCPDPWRHLTSIRPCSIEDAVNPFAQRSCGAWKSFKEVFQEQD